jgi:hypothetical protein
MLDKILEWYADDELIILDGFDEAIIGGRREQPEADLLSV